MQVAFATPPKNGSYLLLDVLWEAEAGKTSSNPLYFSAKDASGRKADLNVFADNQLASGEILPGDKSRGFIAFDIAPGAATVIISDPLLQEAARPDPGVSAGWSLIVRTSDYSLNIYCCSSFGGWFRGVVASWLSTQTQRSKPKWRKSMSTCTDPLVDGATPMSAYETDTGMAHAQRALGAPQ